MHYRSGHWRSLPSGGSTWVEGHYYSREKGYNSQYTQRSNQTQVTAETKNAYCPVCGQPVFFYQNSLGSKVYFDELGPPWEKHPCTITDTEPAVFTQHKTSKHFIKQEPVTNQTQLVNVQVKLNWVSFKIVKIIKGTTRYFYTCRTPDNQIFYFSVARTENQFDEYSITASTKVNDRTMISAYSIEKDTHSNRLITIISKEEYKKETRLDYPRKRKKRKKRH